MHLFIAVLLAGNMRAELAWNLGVVVLCEPTVVGGSVGDES